MAATAEDGNKVYEVVAGEKSTGDEAVGDKIKMITLKSSDGESFEITHEAAALSNTIQHMIEDDCVENGVPLPNVNSKILAKVIEYCNKHAAAARGTSSDDTTSERDLKSFDAEFIEAVDWNTLFEIILAANYLSIQGLLDISCEKVADNIKDKTVEQVRKIFNIEGDFTPEEEAEVRKENQWAFE